MRGQEKEGAAARKRGGKSAAEAAGEAVAEGAEALGAHVEQLRDNVAGARTAAQQTAHDLGGMLREQLDARPYVTLGACAGAGFVLAGGLTPGVLTMVVKHGGRLLASRLLREITGQEG